VREETTTVEKIETSKECLRTLRDHADSTLNVWDKTEQQGGALTEEAVERRPDLRMAVREANDRLAAADAEQAKRDKE
jgi:hypothetical protein